MRWVFPAARPLVYPSTVPDFLYRIQPTRPSMLLEGPTPDEAEAVDALQESAYGLRQRVGLGNTINGRPVDVGPFTRRD